MDDLYGSPTLEDVEAFSRQFYKGLEEAVGEETAWKLSVEVSSPVRSNPLHSALGCRGTRTHLSPLHAFHCKALYSTVHYSWAAQSTSCDCCAPCKDCIHLAWNVSGTVQTYDISVPVLPAGCRKGCASARGAAQI